MPTLNTPQVVVSSMREAQELLRKAAKARQSSGTNANERSSRSHAVITVRASLGLPWCSCDSSTARHVLSIQRGLVDGVAACLV
jgi:hypothetical protein